MSIGAVVLVCLVGACLAVLMAISWVLARFVARLESMHEEVAIRLAEAADNVLDSGAEQRQHLDAVSAIALGQMRQIGQGLQAEIRKARAARPSVRARRGRRPGGGGKNVYNMNSLHGRE